jgi:hypothetical protein
MSFIFKKSTFAIYFLICAWIFTGTAVAQPLWQNTSSGMSVEDVSRLYPDAAPPAYYMKADRSEKLLILKNVVIFNMTFPAGFFFIDKKLDNIHFTLDKQLTPDAGMSVFKSLREELRTKYGKESSGIIREDIKSAGANWNFNGTAIVLNVVNVGNYSLLWVIYGSSNADKQ